MTGIVAPHVEAPAAALAGRPPVWIQLWGLLFEVEQATPAFVHMVRA